MTKAKAKPTEATIRKHLAAIRKAINGPYSTEGPLAFASGQLYGMQNALHWMLGEDVSSPTAIVKQMEHP